GELGDAGAFIGYGLVRCRCRGSGGESGHQTVRARSHQDRVIPFRLPVEPGEILRSFESPPSGPALRGPVAVKRGDEVHEQFLHEVAPWYVEWVMEEGRVHAVGLTGERPSGSRRPRE